MFIDPVFSFRNSVRESNPEWLDVKIHPGLGIAHGVYLVPRPLGSDGYMLMPAVAAFTSAPSNSYGWVVVAERAHRVVAVGPAVREAYPQTFRDLMNIAERMANRLVKIEIRRRNAQKVFRQYEELRHERLRSRAISATIGINDAKDERLVKNRVALVHTCISGIQAMADAVLSVPDLAEEMMPRSFTVENVVNRFRNIRIGLESRIESALARRERNATESEFRKLESEIRELKSEIRKLKSEKRKEESEKPESKSGLAKVERLFRTDPGDETFYVGRVGSVDAIVEAIDGMYVPGAIDCHSTRVLALHKAVRPDDPKNHDPYAVVDSLKQTAMKIATRVSSGKNGVSKSE